MLNYLKQRVKRWSLFYQQSSLQLILSLAFTFASISVIFFVSMGYSRQFSRSTEKLMEENSVAIIDQVNLNLDSYLHEMMGISNAAYYNVFKELDILQDEKEIKEKLEFLYQSNASSLNNIAVFKEDGQLIQAYPLNHLKKGNLVQEQEWFQKASHKIENSHFSTPYVENLYYPENNAYHWVVSLSRSVDLNEKGETSQGVLVLNMNFTEIEKICNSLDLGNSGYVYLVNSKGEIIYHPQQQLLYSGIVKENNEVAAKYPEGSHKENFGEVERHVTVKTMGYSGWKIVGVTPISDYTPIYAGNRKFIWLSALIASIIVLLVNWLISSRVTTPIKNLDKAVLRLEKDINDSEIPNEGTTEIRHLAATLSSLTDTMRRLMKDVIRQEKQKRKTEMTALQAQINPHFLYNTLDSTVWMIEMERYEGAITMITSLADFFRISLSKGKNVITLTEEFEHVESYLRIQHIRYKNKFTYEVEIDPQVADAMTIKLIVQPIVENAIYHGMDYLFGDGEISVAAYLHGKDVYVDITDNGPGMTKSRVAKLFKDKVQTTSKHKGSGIGLSNVQERVKLYFGQSYGLEVKSEPDEGTQIRIIFPYQPIKRREREGEV